MYAMHYFPGSHELNFKRDPATARVLGNYRRLLHAALDFVHAHPKLAPLGPDPLVAHLIAAKGLSEHDVVVIRLVASGRLVTALCAASRLARDPYAREALMQVKAEALEERTRCIIVPQQWLRGAIRTSVSRVLSQSRNVRYSNRQMAAVLKHVKQHRITTLARCAAAVPDHEDPYGVVFAMCCSGVLDIDRSSEISADSWLSSLLR